MLLCVAGSIACSKKEVEKAQIENDVKVEAEKYDDDNEANGTVYVLSVDKVHQKKDFCFVFDIKNKDITAKDCVFEKNTISMEWGNKNSDGKETELSIDDFVGKRVEGTIIYADVPNEIWRDCKDGTDKN